MSAKRRKIEKKKKSDLTRFREDTLMLVQGKDMSTTFGYYCNTFFVSYRTKVKKVEKERFSGCDWTKNSSLWGDGIDQKQYVTDWNAMNGSKRLEELKSYGSEEEFILNSLLKKTKVTSLRNVLNLHFSDSSVDFDKLSKHHLIQEIKNRFYQRTGDIQKRETEEENLAFFDEEQEASQEYHFLYLCNQQIPVDVLRHILTFFNYDSKMLFQIGRISKVFYITILCSWPHVTIRKTNVFKISLLVLRSVRAVTFEVPSSSPGTTFNTKELEYVLKHLNPKRLRTVTIKSMVYTFCRCVKLFCGKVRPVFQNVQTLSFDTSGFLNNVWDSAKLVRKKDYDVYKSLASNKHQLSKSFPQLQKVENPLIFFTLYGLSKLQDLSISLVVPYRFDNKKKIPKIGDTLGMISSNKRDLGIPKEQIRRLTIDIHRYDLDRLELLPKFLSSGFTSLGSLKIVAGNSFFVKRDNQLENSLKSFRLNFAQCFSNIRSLQELRFFERGNSGRTHSLLEIPSSLECLSFGNLKRLYLSERSVSVYSGVYKTEDYNIVDLINCMSFPNLEELEMYISIYGEKSAKNDRHNTLLLEKMNKRLFRFRKIRIGIVVDIANFFLESTSPATKAVGGGERKTKKSCSIEVKSGDSYSWRDINSYESLPRKKVTEFPLLHQLMTDLPTILGKEENRREVTFIDKSGHSFCVYRSEWRKEQEAFKPVNRGSKKKEKKIEVVDESQRIMSGRSCLQFFKEGMIEEEFKCEVKELSFRRSYGCTETVLFV